MRRPKRRPAPKARRSRLVVGVVSAQRCERQALAHALGALGGLEAIDCGAGVAESIARVRDLGIGVVLLSLDVGPASSFTASLLSAVPRVRPVALLRSESEGSLVRLAAAGVVGFVPPGADLTACSRAIRAVSRHGFHCPEPLAAIVLLAKSPDPRIESRRLDRTHPPLHGRRLEVAECIADGLSNKEICVRLGIAEGTVKNHVHAVLAALAVRHRWEVAAALRGLATRIELVPRRDGETG